MNQEEQAAKLKQRSETIEAIAAAHVDAGVYGFGWIRVDHHGNLTRVDPEDIIIAFRRKGPKQSDTF